MPILNQWKQFLLQVLNESVITDVDSMTSALMSRNRMQTYKLSTHWPGLVTVKQIREDLWKEVVTQELLFTVSSCRLYFHVAI